MPRVFISYSHDSTAHSQRVLALAVALRSNGIDVELDQFHTDEIVDWPRWCNEQCSRECSDFVICVCTAEYRRRIEGKVPPEKGKGVYWEGSLLDDDLYDEKGNSRLIPVLFDDEPETSIPRFLRGWTYCRLRDFTLTDPGYETLLRILTGQARVVKNPLGPIPSLSPHPLPTTAGRQIDIGRLRHAAEHFVGREEEISRLDEAWNNSQTHVVSLVAWGGVGKTALVNHWMGRMAADEWRGAERVFDWSFYSQGTREQGGGASADQFVKNALTFFGDAAMAESAAAPWDKGARLAQLVAERRTLLVLDGLEPLQYPPGPLAGQLKDPAIEALLKCLAAHNPGLCLVTTRESVTDLASFRDTTAPEWELEHLSDEASGRLLYYSGVRRAGAAEIGPDDQELRQASREVGGHALTLRLLGGYLALAADGDIRRRNEIDFAAADREYKTSPDDPKKKNPYGHAFKAMRAYERWLTASGVEGARQLAVLRLLGLFDRPASADLLTVLREQPPIAGLTEPLVDLSDRDWSITVRRLSDAGLISLSDNYQLSTIDYPSTLDAHPLTREYFARQVRERNPDGWREAHRRLFEHLCSTTSDRKPAPTLDDLQPLYQAVAHGCQAGLHKEALANVYVPRICRGNAFFSRTNLGAFGADLGAIACFIELPWSRLVPSMSGYAKAWVLNEAAMGLRALGRLKEAAEPMQAGLDMALSLADWRDAAAAAGSLSELKLTLGDVAAAVDDARRSVDFADRSGNAVERFSARATLADVLHQVGRCAEATGLFHEAEAMQAERQPRYPFLYSLRGFRYCDLLLAAAERAAWRLQMAGAGQATTTADLLVTDCGRVEERARQSIKVAEYNNWLLDIGLDHLTFGRAAFYRAILDQSAFGAPDSALVPACRHIEAAVGGLRHSSNYDDIPRGLLTRAWLRVLEGNAGGARSDLDDAREIASRGPMRLFMADIHLYRARLFYKVHPYPWESPQTDLAAARKLINETGYHRRDEELADAEEVILRR